MSTKKYSLIVITLSIISIFMVAGAQKVSQEQKKLNVSLPIEAWQVTLDIIEKSNAPHSQVKQIQEMIIPQLQKQLADTTKTKK